MMKKSRWLLIPTMLISVACGGKMDELEFVSDDEQSPADPGAAASGGGEAVGDPIPAEGGGWSGGSTGYEGDPPDGGSWSGGNTGYGGNPAGCGAIAGSGSGGDPSIGSTGGGGSAGTLVEPDCNDNTGGGGGLSGVYLRGGYAGGQSVVGDDGMPVDTQAELAACQALDGYAFMMQFDEESCTAGTMCAPPCAVDADCPYLVGPAAPVCASLPNRDLRVCMFPCVDDGQCPYGLRCALTDDGFRTCLIPDVPWAPGCTQ